MLFQFMESDEEADGIMPFCNCEAQEERDVCFQPTVITGELEEGAAEVMLFQVAVPSQGSIGVGLPKLRMEPHPFRGIEMYYGFVEKV